MNPQSKSKKKKKLQEQQDIKNAINDYQGVEMNNDALNESSSVFMNSKTVPDDSVGFLQILKRYCRYFLTF